MEYTAYGNLSDRLSLFSPIYEEHLGRGNTSGYHCDFSYCLIFYFVSTVIISLLIPTTLKLNAVS